MDWISVDKRVPEDRRRVLVWGRSWVLGNARRDGEFLGETKYNPTRSGGCFDIERAGHFASYQVTHWAEIVGPGQAQEVMP